MWQTYRMVYASCNGGRPFLIYLVQYSVSDCPTEESSLTHTFDGGGHPKVPSIVDENKYEAY